MLSFICFIRAPYNGTVPPRGHFGNLYNIWCNFLTKLIFKMKIPTQSLLDWFLENISNETYVWTLLEEGWTLWQTCNCKRCRANYLVMTKITSGSIMWLEMNRVGVLRVIAGPHILYIYPYATLLVSSLMNFIDSTRGCEENNGKKKKLQHKNHILTTLNSCSHVCFLKQPIS